MSENDSTVERAREVFWKFFKSEGRLPSYGEICKLFNYASKNAAYRLCQKLIDAGLLEKSPQGKLIPKKLSKPLNLLGSVQAGMPSEEREDIIDTFSLDDYLVDNPSQTFILTVRGDSMIDEGIKPGDLVVVERGPQPRNGQVVLAQIDGEWTLKYFEKKGDQVRLIAGNQKYPPLVPERELTIGGIIRGVVRRYE